MSKCHENDIFHVVFTCITNVWKNNSYVLQCEIKFDQISERKLSVQPRKLLHAYLMLHIPFTNSGSKV